MFLFPSQGSKSRWPPLKATSSSATTCPRLPFRAVWMRSRCPSGPCKGMACCSTPGSQPIMLTCRWGTELCGWSSTWALGPLKRWWSLPVESSMTMSGMMCEWHATFARCVCNCYLSIQCLESGLEFEASKSQIQVLSISPRLYFG